MKETIHWNEEFLRHLSAEQLSTLMAESQLADEFGKHTQALKVQLTRLEIKF